MKTFTDFGIETPTSFNAAGDGLTTCPSCRIKRQSKNQNKKCLSANVTLGVWKCHHCGWSGSLTQGEERPSIKPKIIRRPTYHAAAGLSQEAMNFFLLRGIPAETIIAEKVICAEAWMPEEEDWIPCIQFPFFKRGDVVNIKYRGLRTKSFRQERDAEKVFYRQDSIAKDCVVICEGEIDALSCVVAGFTSAISVPDGAPSVKAKSYASKFEFLDQDPDPLEGVEMIILATDTDEPGLLLREELARRLGRDRCYTVAWPDGCKDANDVLVCEGQAVLRNCLASALPWPIEDEVTVEALTPKIKALAMSGLPAGLSTGWPTLDAAFTILPGQLTIVTGIPSHGKSTFVDALAVNLMQIHGWQFAICSPENYPTELHGVTLMEKWADRTVRTSAPRDEAAVFASEEIDRALKEMHEAFTFIAPDEAMTIAGLLDRATSLVRRRGIRGLIIDPWNEFDHTRDRHLTEAEYISGLLGLVRRWARKWSVHVFIVAHPTKMQKQDDGLYPVPTPYDINGGAAWRNKSDNCLAIWRQIEPNNALVEVHIQKVRFRNLGTMGATVALTFNRWTGRYQ